MKISIVCILLCINFGVSAQKNDTLTFMFYNVENLFDTKDDPNKNDEEFLPEAEREWTQSRFYKKLNNIYKTIAATGWEEPIIVGFAEVENYFCLDQLCMKTPLINKNYKIVHFDSPDTRGIDVALIYNAKKATVLFAKPIHVDISKFNGNKTRDILYAKLEIKGHSIFHVFVNHWPSRRGGETNSEPKRIIAAQTLSHSIDSILTQEPNANIVVMGDFNDAPENKSLTHLKKSTLQNCTICEPTGTLKYRGKWNCFDQFLISPNISNIYNHQFLIVKNSFLLEDDIAHTGTKPKRTYQGPIYKGGFSDHLPILLKVHTK